jgi:hypothetical protein
MFTKALAAAAALTALAAPAAIAGPYVNIESNSGFSGSDYDATTIDNHLGFESDLSDSASWYIQGGPALVLADGADTTTELSGKVGVSVAASENLDVYGEYAFITTEEIDFDAGVNSGVKLGVKYSF